MRKINFIPISRKLGKKILTYYVIHSKKVDFNCLLISSGKNMEERFVPGLPSLDLDGLVQYIKDGHAKNVVFLTGAGTSVAAGIPDFRSPGFGVYSKLKEYNLPYPEAVFTIDYFDKNPVPFFKVKKGSHGIFKPVIAHYLPALFEKHGLLTRIYTQNTDGLNLRAGVSQEKLIEAHGSYNTMTCRKCKTTYKYQDYKDVMAQGDVPYCSCGGVVKPNVVFYGEDLPAYFFVNLEKDFMSCDLFIVIGSSLKVAPCSNLMYEVPENIPRVLINGEKVALCSPDEDNPCEGFMFDHKDNKRDIFIGGDCQVSSMRLIEALGWTQDLQEMMNK